MNTPARKFYENDGRPVPLVPSGLSPVVFRLRWWTKTLFASVVTLVADRRTRPARPQPLGGKTPCKAMQKLKVRYGIILLWGRLPPAGVSICGAIVVFVVLPATYMELPAAK